MGKQLAQHRTQEQGSRIAAAAHLNYEFAMYRLVPPGNRPPFDGVNRYVKLFSRALS